MEIFGDEIKTNNLKTLNSSIKIGSTIISGNGFEQILWEERRENPEHVAPPMPGDSQDPNTPVTDPSGSQDQTTTTNPDDSGNVTAAKPSSSAVRTGDDMLIAPYITAIALAAGAVAVFTVIKKKNKIS